MFVKRNDLAMNFGQIFFPNFELLNFGVQLICECGLYAGVYSSCTQAKGPNELERNLVSVAWSDWEYCYAPLDGMQVHRRVTPSSMSPVPIYTHGWRETMWGRVSCLRKEHNGREWASDRRPSDLKSNALTTAPTCSLYKYYWTTRFLNSASLNG